MEDKMQELSLNQMEQVLGGYECPINTGTSDKAAFRSAARKSASQIGSLTNGTIVEVDKNTLTYDPVSRRNFVMVTTQDGRQGWVAASFVGLKR